MFLLEVGAMVVSDPSLYAQAVEAFKQGKDALDTYQKILEQAQATVGKLNQIKFILVKLGKKMSFLKKLKPLLIH